MQHVHVVEYEVRVGLRDGLLGLYVVTHDHIAQAKVCSGAVRQMADNETVGVSAVLVQDDEVGDLKTMKNENYKV